MKKIRLSYSKYIKFALVDDEDFRRINQYKWNFNGGGYAVSHIKKSKNKWRTDGMHRFIIDVPAGREVDHINRNKLDNRKKNLRIVTRSQNQHNRKLHKFNTSGYPGVSWDKYKQKWVAYTKVMYKKISLGSFTNKKKAYLAYKKYISNHFM